VNEGGLLALRQAAEVSRRIWQICLSSGMGEIKETPPEMHALETRIYSGEREAITFFHLSNKPCLVVPLEMILCFST